MRAPWCACVCIIDTHPYIPQVLVTVISIYPHQNVKIRGIDDHEITSVTIATVGALDNSQDGPAIIIMNQYAYHGKGKTIHSYVQLDWYKNYLNDK